MNIKKNYIILFLCIIIFIIFIFRNILFQPIEKKGMSVSKQHFTNFKIALQQYKEVTGHYPSTKDGLKSLVEKGILKKIPKDQWENEYQYQSPGKNNRKYDIWTYGADEKPGGTGASKDIRNWDKCTAPHKL